MFTTALPHDTAEFMAWGWSQLEPYYQELAERPLSAETVAAWLTDWSQLDDLINEKASRLNLAVNGNTADEAARQRFFIFLDDIRQPASSADQKLKEKLLASGFVPDGMAVALHKIRAAADLFREANVLLRNQETKLTNEYNRLIGSQTVTWDGQETTLNQLQSEFVNPERSVREKAWRLITQRQLADRSTLNALWTKLLTLRREIAANADQPDYRAYLWQNYNRFDYTPEDCTTFHNAIEAVVVPAATRIYDRIRREQGLDTLRPWDLGKDWVNPVARPPLHPYAELADLENKAESIFRQVDPQFGDYFAAMRADHLIDLPNRKNKAPGAFCTSFPVQNVPYIFMNAIGVSDDVQTLLHESGHAFHVFETRALPWSDQKDVGMEFAEVASMSMELLASPYLSAQSGGYYSEPDAARALTEHLEHLVLLWPYIAVVDSFQHWAYTHPDEALDAANCDAKWAELWRRFIPGVDWSGFEQEMLIGWHRKQHIFRAPLYYVEYGLAQLGAVQVWRNSLHNQADAVAHYRQALALGGTVSLPDLYKAAGAKFAFDADTIREAIDLIEQKLAELQQENHSAL